MKRSILFSILMLAVVFTANSQSKRYIITGKITDSLGVIKNANIINLNTYQGTFSSDQGLYRIFCL